MTNLDITNRISSDEGSIVSFLSIALIVVAGVLAIATSFAFI
jgi:hypothetical protein